MIHFRQSFFCVLHVVALPRGVQAWGVPVDVGLVFSNAEEDRWHAFVYVGIDLSVGLAQSREWIPTKLKFTWSESREWQRSYGA